jgi:DNA-binding CsgD family transcriptional regulator
MSENAPSVFRLTAREKEVLVLIASGLSSKQIAHTLHIAFRTVLAHRAHIMAKLNVHGVDELTRSAIQIGLIET